MIEAGGLHILGTERHESRRIDNQLRGRAGRQGDPGSSRFFLSLEDDLMRIFAREWVSTLLQRLGMEEGVPIESRMISSRIEAAQKAVETQNFESRKHVLEYDDVMNKQREAVYGLRHQLWKASTRSSSSPRTTSPPSSLTSSTRTHPRKRTPTNGSSTPSSPRSMTSSAPS